VGRSLSELEAALPEAARARLREAGVEPAELERLLVWDGAALALGGSAVAGFLTPESDLDFLVLRERGEPAEALVAEQALPDVAVQHSTFMDRILAFVGGIEVDVWILDRDRFAGLEETLARSVGARGEIRSLPGLRYLEQKVLARLHEARPIRGADVLADWRRRLRIDSYAGLAVTEALVGALSFLEDAASLLRLASSAGPGARIGGLVAARAAAEPLVRGALAAAGIVGWDVRYAALLHERLLRDGRPAPALLDDLVELLFPAADADAEEYVRRVAEAAASLVEELDRLPGMEPAAAYLRSFGKDRWTLPVDVLG
jgi:hypothetical protein